jgi:hypothetical protein
VAKDTEWVTSIPRAGRLYFGLNRAASYEAAKRGEIPTITVGSRFRVPLKVLEQRLTTEPAVTASPKPQP